MRKNPYKITTFALLALLAVLNGRGFVAEASADPQPKMQAALKLLREAREQLKDATSDKGGHRVKALGLTSQAVDEVEKGIAFDNKH